MTDRHGSTAWPEGGIGFISPVSRHFCTPATVLRLTADGHLRACLLSDHEMDLKTPLRKGGGDQEIRELIRRGDYPETESASRSCDERHMKKCMKEMPAIGG